jgi:hypothetical protein
MEMPDYNPFGLSTYQHNDLRKRTLNGYTFYYACTFQPKNITKPEMQAATQKFKRPTTKKDLEISNRMIKDSVVLFDDMPSFGFKLFDVILLVPSSSSAVKRIYKEIEPRLDHNTLVIERPLQKTRIRNVKLLDWQLDREPSLKTRQRVNECYASFRKKHYDKVTRMHYIPTRFRRYFSNFFKWNRMWVHFADLRDKRILVVDDTFGEGVSLREIMWMLDIGVRPKMMCGFSVMRDCE